MYYTNQQIDQLNMLVDGPATNEVANLIGIKCLRCGIRIYRILDQYYKLKIHSDAKFREKLTANVRRYEEICGRRPSSAEKMNEELFKKVISMFNSEPIVLRKLQWSTEESLFRKSYNYPLHFLILFLGMHTMVKSDKRKSPPYALIGKFLEEQALKTYALEKDVTDGRRALQSSDVTTYFNKAQKIRTSLNKFYQQCQNVYVAPLTLPIRASNADDSIIETTIKVGQKLMVFSDTYAFNENPSFSHLFPPFDEILPTQMD